MDSGPPEPVAIQRPPTKHATWRGTNPAGSSDSDQRAPLSVVTRARPAGPAAPPDHPTATHAVSVVQETLEIEKAEGRSVGAGNELHVPPPSSVVTNSSVPLLSVATLIQTSALTQSSPVVGSVTFPGRDACCHVEPPSWVTSIWPGLPTEGGESST